MAQFEDAATRDRDAEVKRVSQQIAGALAARGVRLTGSEGPEELAQLDEAIERFEAAVESHGGDLMMDEAPRGSKPQPDNPHFALPRRGQHKSVAQYLEQLARATADVRKQPPRVG